MKRVKGGSTLRRVKQGVSLIPRLFPVIPVIPVILPVSHLFPLSLGDLPGFLHCFSLLFLGIPGYFLIYSLPNPGKSPIKR